MALKTKRDGQHTVSWTPQQQQPQLPLVQHQYPQYPRTPVFTKVVCKLADIAERHKAGTLEGPLRFEIFSALGELFHK